MRDGLYLAHDRWDCKYHLGLVSTSRQATNCVHSRLRRSSPRMISPASPPASPRYGRASQALLPQTHTAPPFRHSRQITSPQLMHWKARRCSDVSFMNRARSWRSRSRMGRPQHTQICRVSGSLLVDRGIIVMVSSRFVGLNRIPSSYPSIAATARAWVGVRDVEPHGSQSMDRRSGSRGWIGLCNFKRSAVSKIAGWDGDGCDADHKIM